MNYLAFINTFKGMARERIYTRITTVVLSVTCLMLVFALMGRDPVVILVPPELSQESEISANNASAAVKKAWGLVVANLVGNVTPGNIGFVERSLEGILAPSLYHELLESLQQQALTVKEGQISLTFMPSDVAFQASKNKIYVSGDSTKKGPFSDPITEKKTYEFEIVIRNYRPYVAFWDVYPGGPRIDRGMPKETREPVQMSMRELE